MRAPEFWQAGKGGWASAVLAPLGAVYGAVTKARAARPATWTAPVPVICVGNVVAGGAGKTQVVLDLAERLMLMGRQPHVLLRGYGGNVAGPHPVDPAADTPDGVGDEALLAAAIAPAWIGADRVGSARMAVDAGADVLIMDDGLQNPGLAKTLSLVVFDGAYGIGNGRCIPAGPLREPLATALARADAVVRIGEGETAIGTSGLEVFSAVTVPASTAPNIEGERVVAFAGIGQPEKFFETLSALGAELVGRHAFADHHPFTQRDMAGLIAEASGAGARLITTAKDFVRIPPAQKDRVEVFPVMLEWRDASALTLYLEKSLGLNR